MEEGLYLRCLRRSVECEPGETPRAVILGDAKNPQPGIRGTNADSAVPREGGCTRIERFAPGYCREEPYRNPPSVIK